MDDYTRGNGHQPPYQLNFRSVDEGNDGVRPLNHFPLKEGRSADDAVLKLKLKENLCA